MTWVYERRMDPSDPDDQEQWYAALRRARIPERHWDACPELVKGNNQWMFQALAGPEAWAGRGYGFYIHGQFNTGKSAAAAILAMEFVRRCHVVVWLSVRDVAGVRFRESDDAKERNAMLERADLVVLDDLGSERFKLDGAGGSALEETVRIAYDRGRSMLITSNHSWDVFPKVYGAVPALVSVVQRLSLPVVLTRQWPNEPGIGMAGV